MVSTFNLLLFVPALASTPSGVAAPNSTDASDFPEFIVPGRSTIIGKPQPTVT